MRQDLEISKISSERVNNKKKKLSAVINKKRGLLKELIAKSEMLKVSLDMAKHEYMVRVGSLFLKDNQLELEIICLNNVLQLMHQGYSREEAELKISKNFYAQKADIEEEREEILEEEKIIKKREENTLVPQEKVKEVWKRLVFRFHPDLIQDPLEKQKRETIMTQINLAYQENDFDRLVRIEKENGVTSEMTVSNLEELLAILTEEIRQQKLSFLELKKSEWYEWMLKIEYAKKKSINIFADTEKRLLNDIVAKFDAIKKLKSKISSFESFDA